MKYLPVVMGLVLLFTLSLLAVIHSRRTMEQQLTKTSYFESVKQKVTVDVLKEFKANVAEANKRIEQTKKEIAELTAGMETAQANADGKKTELKTCTDELRDLTAEIVEIEAERNKTNTEFQRKKTSLMEQTQNLKILVGKRSKMCDYIIKSSVEAMKLCGIVAVLPAEAKPAKAA